MSISPNSGAILRPLKDWELCKGEGQKVVNYIYYYKYLSYNSVNRGFILHMHEKSGAY